MSFQSVVPCPDCGSDIHIDSNLLLSGSSFKCSNQHCGVAISLDESSLGEVKDAFEKFEELKEESIRGANENTSL